MTITINPGLTLNPGTSIIVPAIPIISDGLVLHYDFSNTACYPGSGTAITDLSAANNAGTVVNDFGAISYVSSGQTSYFNWSTNAGGSGTNVFNGSINTASANTYRDFTMVFEPDFSASGITGLICVPNDKSLRVYNNGWQFPNPGNNDDWASSATTYYINGQISNQAVPGWNIAGGARNNNAFAEPALLYVGTSGYGNRNMQGKIAMLLMYNRVLSQPEQLQNYNALKARFSL